MSILEYNGAAIIAMRGKDCVAIASDLRMGIQFQTVSTNFQKIFEMGPTLFLGLPGLATDVQTVWEKLQFKVKLYELREAHSIRPKTLMNVVSNLLYEHRFGPYFLEPVIAGVDQVNGEPYIACMDLLGSSMEMDDFVVSGTCTEQMYGMCESLWTPDMSPDDLFETISQALMNAVDRDAASGWGGIVHIIEKHQVTTKTLKTRMD